MNLKRETRTTRKGIQVDTGILIVIGLIILALVGAGVLLTGTRLLDRAVQILKQFIVAISCL